MTCIRLEARSPTVYCLPSGYSKCRIVSTMSSRRGSPLRCSRNLPTYSCVAIQFCVRTSMLGAVSAAWKAFCRNGMSSTGMLATAWQNARQASGSANPATRSTSPASATPSSRPSTMSRIAGSCREIAARVKCRSQECRSQPCSGWSISFGLSSSSGAGWNFAPRMPDPLENRSDSSMTRETSAYRLATHSSSTVLATGQFATRSSAIASNWSPKLGSARSKALCQSRAGQVGLSDAGPAVMRPPGGV